MYADSRYGTMKLYLKLIKRDFFQTSAPYCDDSRQPYIQLKKTYNYRMENNHVSSHVTPTAHDSRKPKTEHDTMSHVNLRITCSCYLGPVSTH